MEARGDKRVPGRLLAVGEVAAVEATGVARVPPESRAFEMRAWGGALELQLAPMSGLALALPLALILALILIVPSA